MGIHPQPLDMDEYLDELLAEMPLADAPTPAPPAAEVSPNFISPAESFPPYDKADQVRAMDLEVPTRPQHEAASFRKLAEAIASCSDRQRIIISAKPSEDPSSLFYVYDSAEALDRDASALFACRFVRECIKPRWMRKAFADIDVKRYSDRTLAVAWKEAWPNDVAPQIYSTTKGAHLVGADWVTVKEHREGLSRLAELLPGDAVDLGVFRTLRLAGTIDKLGNGRKELPEGLSLSDTLVQPLGAPSDHDAEEKADRAVGEGIVVTEAEIAAGVSALTNSPGALVFVECVGERVNLRRTEASDCLICGRVHDSANAFLIIAPGDDSARAYCHRSKKCAYFKRPGIVTDREKKYPGAFNTRTGTSYELAGGVAAAPSGDYIEGSPCGLGKSKAAWASIEAAVSQCRKTRPSVLLASYRKTFSASQGGLHDCKQYSDTKAALVMEKGCRWVCQYESLRRIKGAPDIFVVDELHGIRRQAVGDLAGAESWAAFSRLVRESGRLIVLDAYADDSDKALLSEIRGRPIELVRNTFKPHSDKVISSFASYNDYKDAFDIAMTSFANKPKEVRLANRIVVVCQWRKDVEEVARKLETMGLRGKAYHGKTCAKTRAAEFADHEKAWAEAEFIVYNSTLEAGVSIEGSEWGSAWVLMRGMGHVEAAIQSLHRFRSIKRYFSYAAPCFGGGDYPTSEAGLVTAILAGERFAADDTGSSIPAGEKVREYNAAAYVAKMIKLGEDPNRSSYARLWIANTLEGNRSARYWSSRFYKMLGDTGFEVRSLSLGAIQAMVAEKKEEPSSLAPLAPVSFLTSPADRIATADASIWRDILEANNGDPPVRDLSEAEIHSRDKYALMREYGLPEEKILEPLVEVFGTPKAITNHRNIRELASTEANTHTQAVARLRDREKRNTLGAASCLPPRDPTKKTKIFGSIAPRIASSAEKASRALDAFRALGFSGLEDKRVIAREAVEKALKDSTELAEVYAARGRLWPDVRKPRKPPDLLRSHLAALNGILGEQYGAKVVAVNKRCDKFSIEHAEWPDDILGQWTSPPPQEKVAQTLPDLLSDDLFT